MKKKTVKTMESLRNLKVIGDRVLILPDDGATRTASGLYLPPTVTEKEKVQGGYVVAVGPGTPMLDPEAIEESWKGSDPNGVKYIPLEVNVGDYVLFLKKAAIEITYKNTRYLIVPVSGILLAESDDQIDLDQLLEETES